MNRLFSVLEPITSNQGQQATSKQAAVLLPLWENAHGWWLTLTKRASHLRNHPGQISLPGGIRESTDPSLVATALRETWEEIGLHPKHFNVLGRLPPIQTTTNFEVHPFVAVYQSRPRIVHCTDEVEDVFQVPLTWVVQRDRWHREFWCQGGHRVPYWAAWYEDRLIWGATATILRELAERWLSRVD